ncbi:MAG: peroxidase family protein [Arenibacterium sp.]
MNNLAYTIRSAFYANRNYVKDVLKSVGAALLAVLAVPAKILAPLLIPPVFTLFHELHERVPGLWKRLTRPHFVRILITKFAILKFGNNTKPRPHPFSMYADYPTWTGLVNRHFTGRHLGRLDPDKSNPVRPDPAALEHLFMRPVPTGGQVDDIRSNLLFASFAQWFTDSFLRTSHKLEYDGDGNTVDLPDGTKERGTGRERENDSNHEIDLCQIYGVNRKATDILRFRAKDPGYDPERDKGTLKSQWIDGEEFPAKLLAEVPEHPNAPDDTSPRSPLTFVEGFGALYEDEKLVRSIFASAIQNANGYESLFACGLEHGNSTIGNSLFNTIFLRHHNFVARAIAKAHPEFDENEVFEKARNVMIVLLLKIVICDYVSHISPLNWPFTVPPNAGKNQNWYRRNRIHIEFNLLYRWHSLIPDVFGFLGDTEDQKKNFMKFRHNNDWLMQNGVAQTLYDFIATPAGKMTLGNTPQALRLVKRETLRLMRDSELQSYNAYRERFGLHPAESFEEVTGEKVVAAALSDLYEGRIEDLEFYIGLVAERHQRGGMMGDLMLNMVAHDALTHALTNPLLAEEMSDLVDGYDEPGEHVFSKTGLKFIAEIETLDQLCRNVVSGLDAEKPVWFRKPGV